MKNESDKTTVNLNNAAKVKRYKYEYVSSESNL